MRPLPTLLLAALTGCAPEAPVQPNVPVQPNDPVQPNGPVQPSVPVQPNTSVEPRTEDALTRANAAAGRLASTLKSRVAEELGKGGPAAAVDVCYAEAPAIAAAISAETGVSLGRSSSRLRNPANTAPAWVQDWLVAQGERPAASAVPLATVTDGKARVIKPIPVEAPCLACHGAAETLTPEVQRGISARYPADRATGYAVGDLRGALWAEVAVNPG